MFCCRFWLSVLIDEMTASGRTLPETSLIGAKKCVRPVVDRVRLVCSVVWTPCRDKAHTTLTSQLCKCVSRWVVIIATDASGTSALSKQPLLENIFLLCNFFGPEGVMNMFCCRFWLSVIIDAVAASGRTLPETSLNMCRCWQGIDRTLRCAMH